MIGVELIQAGIHPAKQVYFYAITAIITSIEKTCNTPKEAENVYTLLMKIKYSIEG